MAGRLDRAKPKILVIFSGVVFAAAFDAGHGAAEATHPREHGRTRRTREEKFPRHVAAFERQVVAPRLVRDTEIGAGQSPFGAMGIDPASSGPVFGEKVGEFMAQRAVDFGGGDLDKFRIEDDPSVAPDCATGGRAQGGFPAD